MSSSPLRRARRRLLMVVSIFALIGITSISAKRQQAGTLSDHPLNLQPSAGGDLDTSFYPGTGYDFWLTKLNQFSGNYVDAEMVKAFISSIEYRQRFGP